MERFCDPYIPKSRVKRVFVSQLMPDSLISELNDMGIRTYKLGKTKNISSELTFHPDILLNNFRKGRWMCENNAEYLPTDIPRRMILESDCELGNIYPYECLFNNFRIGKALICGKSADYLIKAYARYDEYRIVYVIQNYTKCCTIPINQNAVITCDYYVGRTLRFNGLDVLTVNDSDDIGLRGFSHGLLGGCAGMLSDKLLGFTGNLNKYANGNEIRDFCANHGVDAYSLSSEPMYDYGGILPLSEVVPMGEEDTATDVFEQMQEINI